MLGDDARNYYLLKIAHEFFSKGVRYVSEADVDEVRTIVRKHAVGGGDSPYHVRGAFASVGLAEYL